MSLRETLWLQHQQFVCVCVCVGKYIRERMNVTQ